MAKNARRILKELKYNANTCELAAIAGYVHDLGNVVSRHAYQEHSAHLAGQFLKELNMPVEARVLVMSAVGNHDEGACDIVSPVSAVRINPMSRSTAASDQILNQYSVLLSSVLVPSMTWPLPWLATANHYDLRIVGHVRFPQSTLSHRTVYYQPPECCYRISSAKFLSRNLTHKGNNRLSAAGWGEGGGLLSLKYVSKIYRIVKLIVYSQR